MSLIEFVNKRKGRHSRQNWSCLFVCFKERKICAYVKAEGRPHGEGSTGGTQEGRGTFEVFPKNQKEVGSQVLGEASLYRSGNTSPQTIPPKYEGQLGGLTTRRQMCVEVTDEVGKGRASDHLSLLGKETGDAILICHEGGEDIWEPGGSNRKEAVQKPHE